MCSLAHLQSALQSRRLAGSAQTNCSLAVRNSISTHMLPATCWEEQCTRPYGKTAAGSQAMTMPSLYHCALLWAAPLHYPQKVQTHPVCTSWAEQ